MASCKQHLPELSGEHSLTTANSYERPPTPDIGIRRLPRGAASATQEIDLSTSTKENSSDALNWYVTLGWVPQVRQLLHRGMYPDTRSALYAGRSPLILTVLHKTNLCRQQMIELLLQFGADQRCQDNDGRNALSYAAQNGDLQTIRILLNSPHICDALQSQDSDGRIPLHYAIASDRSDYESVHALVMAYEQHGISVDVPDAVGITPLMLAVKVHSAYSARLLVVEGHASASRASRRGYDPSHLIADGGSNEDVGVIRQRSNGCLPATVQSECQQRRRASFTAIPSSGSIRGHEKIGINAKGGKRCRRYRASLGSRYSYYTGETPFASSDPSIYSLVMNSKGNSNPSFFASTPERLYSSRSVPSSPIQRRLVNTQNDIVTVLNRDASSQSPDLKKFPTLPSLTVSKSCDQAHDSPRWRRQQTTIAKLPVIHVESSC